MFKLCVSLCVYGQNPEKQNSKIEKNPELDEIQNGQNPESDKIPNGQTPELDKLPNGHPELEKIQMDKIPNCTKSQIGKNPELHIDLGFVFWVIGAIFQAFLLFQFLQQFSIKQITISSENGEEENQNQESSCSQSWNKR